MRGRVFAGIFLIVIGLGFLLQQLDLFSFSYLIQNYWPMLIIALGLYKMLARDRAFIFGVLILALGILLQLNELNVLTGRVFSYFFPIALIILGVSFIFTKGSTKTYNKNDTKNNYQSESKENRNYDYKRNENTFERHSDYVDGSVFLSSKKELIISNSFKGGRATSLLGGYDIDLRNTKAEKNTIEIDLTTVLGGIKIFIPNSWMIESRVTPILGSVEIKGAHIPTEEDRVILVLTGTLLLGGVEVIYG